MKKIKILILFIGAVLLFNSSAAIVIGNPTGSVTMVEVMSYSCEHCHNMWPIVDGIQKLNPKLKIKLYPIATDQASLEAVTAAYALAKQNTDLFIDLHHFLLTKDRTNSEIRSFLKNLPINQKMLSQDQHEKWVLKELLLGANLLSVYQSGTPLFLIYPTNNPEFIVVLRGEVSYEQLQNAIKEVS